jgi:membrane associated rhomboid family serine protease
MNEQIPLMCLSLIISIALISIMAFNNRNLFEQCKHYPYLEKRQGSYYRWFTCGFLHGDWMHLLLNLFVLWQFGFAIESIYKANFGFLTGGLIFLVVYILILVLSNIPTYYKHKNNPSYASIGASGAISGILFIYVLYYPFRLLYLFGIVPLPGVAMAILYLVYSRWASKNSADHIDHDAHYYGAVIGLGLGLIVKYLV